MEESSQSLSCLDKSRVLSEQEFIETIKQCSFLNVVVTMIFQNEKLLLTYRELGKPQGGHWELPGGKVKKGETDEDAIIREVKEELDISAKKLSHLTDIYYCYDERLTVRLAIWNIKYYEGEIKNREAQCLRWVELAELPILPLTRANRVAIAKGLEQYHEKEMCNE
jgi:8-oxo-dGTP diphosphatase